MSGKILYKRDDSPVSLEAHHIRKNYKTFKKEMNTEIVDYLVQSYILTTDENSSLLDKSRAEKCDFILRRLIQDSNCLKKFVTLLHDEAKDLDEFDCFRSLLCNTSPEPEILNSDKQGISSPPATPPRPRPPPSSSSSSSSSSINHNLLS